MVSLPTDEITAMVRFRSTLDGVPYQSILVLMLPSSNALQIEASPSGGDLRLTMLVGDVRTRAVPAALFVELTHYRIVT